VDTLWLAIGLAIGYIAFLAILEITKRKLNWSAELTRRLAHIVTGLCTILNFSILPSYLFLSLVALAFLGTFVTDRFKLLSSIHQVSRQTYGEYFLPIGAFAAWFVCSGQAHIYVPAILIMTFADSFAGLVSNIYGQPRKMLRGSLVFFLVATLILHFTRFTFELSLVFGVALALVERFSPKGSDNLTVPLAAALLLML